jgi:CheY-like chemotaxis protein
MGPLQLLKERLRTSAPTAPLRTYLLAGVLLCVAPVVAVMGVNAYMNADGERTRAEDELRRIAYTLAQSVEHETGSSYEALALLARSDAIQQGEPSRLNRVQDWRLRRDWDSVFVLDRDGAVLMDTRAPGAADKSLNELHRRISAGGRPAATAIVDGSTGRIGAVALAIPVRQAGVVRYVVGARVASPMWQNLLGTAGLPEGAHAGLFDDQSRAIADTDPRADALTSAEVAAAPEAAAVRRVHDSRGREMYAAWQTVAAAQWRVVVSQLARPIEAAQRRGTIAALVAGGASLLLGVWLALLAARRIASPLQRLAHLGPTAVTGPLPVREIALLRDAMQRDLEDAEASRDALEAQAQQFELLFYRSPVATAFAQDGACRAVVQNEAMDRLAGPPGSAMSRSLRVTHKGQPIQRAEWPLQRAAATGDAVLDLELEIGGEGRPSTFVIANAIPLFDMEGQVRGAICTLADITPRKQAETRLLASGHQMRQAYRLMEQAQQAGHAGFLDYRFNTDRLIWTQGLCKLHGIERLSSKEGLKQWYELMNSGDRERVERELWTACALRREKETLEYGVEWPDGSAHRISCRVLIRYDHEGRAAQMVGIALEITERPRAEREQAGLEERDVLRRTPAEPASPADRAPLAKLGHELRNPLGAILAASHVLESARPDSESSAQAREIIARQARKLSQILHEALREGRSVPDPVLQPGAEPAPPPARRRNVLVVEDNGDVLAALRSKLELDGHVVSTAVDGVEGLSSLLKLKPEVSIVDIGLPGITGYELARHARAAGYAGRMIAISGGGEDRDAREALVAGFDAYLVKPVEGSELRASLSVE